MTISHDFASAADTISASPNQIHCLYSAIARLLRVYKASPLTDATVCVNSTILGFGLGIRPESSEGMPSIKIIGAVMSRSKLQKCLGVDVCWRRDPDANSSWKLTEDILRTGASQVVATDIFHIPYLLQHYQRHHFPHILMLTGLSETGFEVDDASVQRIVSRKLLARARLGGPCDLEHDWLDLRYVGSDDRMDARAALMTGLGKSDLSRCSALSIRHAAGEPAKVCWGIQAAIAFEDALSSWCRSLSQEQLGRMGQRLYYQLTREVIFPRRLFGEIVRTECSEDAANRHQTLTVRWVAVAGLVLKNLLYLSPAGLLNGIIGEKLRRLVAEEEDHWQQLRDSRETGGWR